MARKCSAMRAEEKLGGFATAKKHITVQYNERERSVDNLLSLIRRDVIENHLGDIKEFVRAIINLER